MDSIIDILRQRKSKSPFGYGLSTAEPYVKQVLKNHGACELFCVDDAEALLKHASDVLTYSAPEMVIEEKATTSSEFGGLLPKGMKPPKNTLMVIRHVLTSTKEDRDNDILSTDGAVLDPKAPLLWQHMHTLPIGAVLAEVDRTKDSLKVVSALLDLNDLTSDAAKLIEANVMRFSHGFRAIEFEERKSEEETDGWPGFNITKYEIMEGSLVSVPSNTDAEVEVFATAKMNSEFFKSMQKSVMDQAMQSRPAQELGVDLKETQLTLKLGGTEVTVKAVDGMKQQPKQVSQVNRIKTFTPEQERLEPSRLEYDWASRFLGCEIKDLVVIETYVPGIRKGSYFTGEDLIKKSLGYEMNDHRRITRDGKECPPLHETIQCNSTSFITYMSDGMEFLSGKRQKLVVKHTKCWSDVEITTYAKDTTGQELIDKCWDWAITNNMLKGEAFSLSGDFLSREGTKQSDIFLNPTNTKALARTIELLNKPRSNMASRGIVMEGAPGTGKTLSCRAIKNETEATYIWVSARDFWRFGSVDGICSGFDMAKELAPSVLVFEDVDNWIGKHSLDLLKTEMDGVDQSKGVLTILTTNYPEKMPSELIDRPGRFHDILEYHLPDKHVRAAMLKAWADDLDAKGVKEVVDKTEGYSGAHMYELTVFAKVLAEEDEKLDTKSSILQAVEKIDSQRALIDQTQLAGSNYRPNRRQASLSSKDFLQRTSCRSAKYMDYKSAVGQVVALGNMQQLQNLKQIIDAMLSVQELDAKASQYRTFVG
jgi:hypothetical protein